MATLIERYKGMATQEQRGVKIVTAAGLSFCLLWGGVCYEIGKTDESSNFARNFTDEDKCLDGTVFDDSEGAHTESDDGLVYVIPKRPNFVDPSILVLQVDSHGLGRPTFAPADIPTAGYLAERHCPGAEDGL